MIQQVSMYDVLAEGEPKKEIHLPEAPGERVYTIPEDVWATRCRICIHRNADKNAQIPISIVHKPYYEKLIPCRIMSVARPNEMPGECMSFAPRRDLYGICATCRHDNCFMDGFCDKPGHAEQHRLYYGQDYGGDDRKRDYWGRHCLSTCDDYDPDEGVQEVPE